MFRQKMSQTKHGPSDNEIVVN